MTEETPAREFIEFGPVVGMVDAYTINPADNAEPTYPVIVGAFSVGVAAIREYGPAIALSTQREDGSGIMTVLSIEDAFEFEQHLASAISACVAASGRKRPSDDSDNPENPN
ncbi:MAG: hypothetical protein VYD90_10750 [Pseudomonadota bacterium]|nr:hypothetical protein [Pseudomonadota bacterium]